MTPPVGAKRIATASKLLENADVAAVACREAGLPYFAACALLEKESGGRNMFGHDKGGALSGYPGEVTADTYAVFRWLVLDQRVTSNGVGPCQITWRGYFRDMEKQGLKPYDVHDNMLYGFRLLKRHHDATGTWEGAGTRYNGSAAYGDDLAKRVHEWAVRLGIAKPDPNARPYHQPS